MRKLKLSSYDFFIFATELRFFQDDKTIYTQLVNDLKKPCFLVRNKFDQAVGDAEHDGSGMTEDELKDDISRNIRENLAPLQIDKVYMVSARRPAHYDLPALLDDIRSAFVGMKRLRLENDLAAWSTDALDRKRDNAMKITSWYASAAALNGLNPIPGLDVTVDLAILKQLCREVAEIYSLTPEQADYWGGMLKGPHGRAILQKAVSLTLRYGSEAAITKILTTIGKREVPKAFAKYLPVVGPVMSAAAGFGLTFWFGKGLVDEYHEMATEILQQLSSANEDT